MSHIKSKENCKIIEDIVKNWELKSHGIDLMVMDDIEAAIEEAYMSGCCAGGMDSEAFREGLEFCKQIKE